MFYAVSMRTTPDLDDDVLSAAKALAEQRGLTIGKTISELVRHALTTSKASATTRNGVPLFPGKGRKAKLVTMDLVNRLRDELP